MQNMEKIYSREGVTRFIVEESGNLNRHNYIYNKVSDVGREVGKKHHDVFKERMSSERIFWTKEELKLIFMALTEKTQDEGEVGKNYRMAGITVQVLNDALALLLRQHNHVF